MVPNIDGTIGHTIKTRKHPRHRKQCVIQYPTNRNPAQSFQENAITVFGPRLAGTQWCASNHPVCCRKGLGSCDALFCMFHTLQSALDSGQEVRIVPMEFCMNSVIIINKKYWQCKSGRGRLTPYQSEDPSPTLPTYRGK